MRAAIAIFGIVLNDTLQSTGAPFSVAFNSIFGGDWGGELVDLFAVISGIGALNGWTMINGADIVREEAITVPQAVRLYTARSVELAPFEDALGQSAEGFEASFIVLDCDIFAKVGVVTGVVAIFGLHVMNRKAGIIQVTRGAATTGADGFYLTAEGRGTRGSMPQDRIDPVLVGSQIVLGPADSSRELFSMSLTLATRSSREAGHVGQPGMKAK